MFTVSLGTIFVITCTIVFIMSMVFAKKRELVGLCFACSIPFVSVVAFCNRMYDMEKRDVAYNNAVVHNMSSELQYLMQISTQMNYPRAKDPWVSSFSEPHYKRYSPEALIWGVPPLSNYSCANQNQEYYELHLCLYREC